MSRPQICVAGKNDIAVSALRYFLDRYSDHPICFIPNANDSGFNSWQPSLIQHATAWGVRRTTLDELYDDNELRFFSLEFDKLIRVNRFASRYLYNFHFSKLPKYRGVYTAAQPILHGESESGVTLHLMDDGIDTGDIIDGLDVLIGPNDTVRDLYFNNLEAAKRLFLKNVDCLVAGEFKARPQSLHGATYYSLRSINYSDIRLDLKKTAFEIHNQVRAYVFREFQVPTWQGWGICRSEITQQRSFTQAGRLLEESEAYFRISSIDNDVLLFKDYQPKLWAAAESGDLESLKTALAHGANVDLRNRNGWSAMIIAAYHGQVGVMRSLLAAGADPDGTNYKGTTVLMYALSRYEQSREIAAFDLIAQVAQRFDAIDDTGRSLRDWIIEKQLFDLLKHLPG